MKTRKNIFGGLMLAAAALVCLTGCKKDDEGEKVVLGADFEQTAGMQKTYVGNGDRTIYWNAGDEVWVNSQKYTVNEGAVEVKLADSYYAVYPATNDNKNVTKAGGTVVIPATQEYKVVDGVQQLNGPMAARLDSKTGRLLFRNLYAVIKVTVKAKETEPFTLNSITVESTENIAGTENFSFIASKSGKTDSVSITGLANSTGSKSVTLTFAKDTTIPANNSASFYLYLLPYTPKDITIKLNRNQKDSKDRSSYETKVERSRLGYTTVDVNDLEMEIGIGTFKVAEGKYVTFSPGNLQYQASTKTWRFAEHQYDFLGGVDINWDNGINQWKIMKGDISVKGNSRGNSATDNVYVSAGNVYEFNPERDNQNLWIDLFGWGTINNPTCYEPQHNKEPVYANYGPASGNLTADDDWGNVAILNPITGTNDAAGTWRTLTAAEWTYLYNNNDCGFITITDIDASNSEDYRSMVILPIGFVDPKVASTNGGVFQKSKQADQFNHNSYTKANWAKMEAAGAVLLPCSGSRNGTAGNGSGHNLSVGGIYSLSNHSKAYYWSSTVYSGEKASAFMYQNGTVDNYVENINKHTGAAVRLVKDIE